MSLPVESTALVLAGGLGTRLRECVSDRPKVLAPVADKPFLAHLLGQLHACGFKKVVLCTGYLGEMIETAFGSSFEGMSLAYSREDEPLGTGGAITHAMPLVDSDDVLVLNGDSYCSTDLAAFVHWAQARSAVAALVAVEVADTSRFGLVHVTDDGCVTSFEEKGTCRGEGHINAGIYHFQSEFLRRLPSDGFLSLEKEVLPYLTPITLRGYQAQGRFIDIGTKESFDASEEFFRSEVQV